MHFELILAIRDTACYICHPAVLTGSMNFSLTDLLHIPL